MYEILYMQIKYSIWADSYMNRIDWLIKEQKNGKRKKLEEGLLFCKSDDPRFRQLMCPVSVLCWVLTVANSKFDSSFKKKKKKSSCTAKM